MEIIKIIGIGLISVIIIVILKQYKPEFAVSICKDTGENAIASKVDIGGKVIIISMSIPIISALLETVLKILPWKRSKKIGKKDNNYINHNNVVFHAKQSTCYAK